MKNKSLLIRGIKKERSRFSLRDKIIFSTCLGLLLYIIIFLISLPTRTQTLLLKRECKVLINNNKHKNNGFLIKTPGCRIPYMKTFDSSIKKFIFKEKSRICNKKLPAVIDSNSTSIFIVNLSISKYIHQNNNTFKCCYQTFTRKEPENNEDDDQIKYSNYCTPFNQSARISSEFIKVQCFDKNNITFYQDFFAFVPLKQKKKKTTQTQDQKLNVLIIGIDGVSRLNFHRQMPKTVEYLKNLSAVKLLGYNKVGLNTYPNLIPILTGLNEDELNETCLDNKNDQRFDKCPFIWKNYKKKGFTTAFGEDAAWMGIFHLYLKGFKKQPTDYMWNTFNRISEELIGNSPSKNFDACVGAREVYKVLLDYISNFVQKMHDEHLNYFGFFWGCSLTHDQLNKGSLGDSDYYHFFKKLNESQYLNKTVLIVLSDHGMRFGRIQRTFQGQMEGRLPFLFMVLPEWYQKKNQEAYNNLKKNEKKLTTPFDLHETLKDLLDPFQLNADYLNNRSNEESTRGISLFSKIPLNRTCEDAGIPNEWCTCQKSEEFVKSDENVAKTALFAVDFINRQLGNYLQYDGDKLTLKSIKSVRIMTHVDDVILRDHHIKDYVIVFETVPRLAVFEVTVRCYFRMDKYLVFLNDQMEVIGTTSRLKISGNQASCNTNQFCLNIYWFCMITIFLIAV